MFSIKSDLWFTLSIIIVWLGSTQSSNQLGQYPYTPSLQPIATAYQSSDLSLSLLHKSNAGTKPQAELTAKNIGFLPNFTDLGKLQRPKSSSSSSSLGFPPGPGGSNETPTPTSFTKEDKDSFKVLAQITKTHFSCYNALPLNTSDLVPVE